MIPDALSGIPRLRTVYCWRRRRYIVALVIDIGRPDAGDVADPDLLLEQGRPRRAEPLPGTRNVRGVAAAQQVAEYLRAHGPATKRQLARGLGKSGYYIWSTLFGNPDTFVRVGIGTGPSGGDVWGIKGE